MWEHSETRRAGVIFIETNEQIIERIVRRAVGAGVRGARRSDGQMDVLIIYHYRFTHHTRSPPPFSTPYNVVTRSRQGGRRLTDGTTTSE
jgi:hypothetical protein